MGGGRWLVGVAGWGGGLLGYEGWSLILLLCCEMGDKAGD